MLSWILDNLVFVIATVTIVALIIAFVAYRFAWYRRLSQPIEYIPEPQCPNEPTEWARDEETVGASPL